MSNISIGLIGVLAFLVLAVLGMRIAFAAALVGVAGIISIQGWTAGTANAGYLPQSIVGSYAYSTIPLFIIMGEFAFHSGLSAELYEAARKWMGHMPGGLAIATAFAGAAFAACSGSSVASAAILGRTAVPEMRAAGYETKLSVGIVAMAGCLAVLIPPSILMVVYGILTEQSIGAVMMAGFIPGIFTAIAYAVLIYVRARLDPRLAPATQRYPWKVRLTSLGSIWKVIVLVILVLGGIYTGIFSAIEAGAVGAFGAFILAILARRLTWLTLKASLLETMSTTVMVFAIMLGVSIFIRFLALSGVTNALSIFVISLPVPRMVILIGMVLIYLVLGMFMEPVSMIMLTMPLFFPAILALGFDPVWFGIIVIIMCEVCLVTPPVGVSCFVVQNVVSDVSLSDVFRGIFPYLLVEFAVLALIIAFPEIALFLPHRMGMR